MIIPLTAFDEANLSALNLMLDEIKWMPRFLYVDTAPTSSQVSTGAITVLDDGSTQGLVLKTGKGTLVTFPTTLSGTLGGWNITTGYLYSLASGTPISSPTDGVVLASGNPALICYEDGAKRLEAGYLSTGIYGLRVYDTEGSNVLLELSDTTQVIGGFSLGMTSLTFGTGANTVGMDSGGTNPAFYCGSATPGSAPFRVTKAGALTSTSGSIGGWTIASDKLSYGTDADFIGLIPATGIQMGDSTFGDAPFSVTIAGVLKATSGTIGGWNLAATTLASSATPSTANILLDQSNGQIRLGTSLATYLLLDGVNKKISTSDFASGALGSGWAIDNTYAEFNNIRARGRFTTAVFEKETISSIGGNFLVSDSDILETDMTALDASTLSATGDTTFAVNDILRIKDGVDDEWMVVTAVAMNYTKLLINFEGLDAATTHTAETGQTLTFAGDAQLDTAQSKFGTGSLLLDGTGDYITAPASADWNFTGDFTIDFWWKGDAINTTLIKSVTTGTNGTESSGDWILYVDGNGILGFSVWGGLGSTSSVATLSTGTWYHLAVVRYNNSVQLYINGTASGTPLSQAATFGNTNILNIGQNEVEKTIGLDGWIDEVRISKGIARWTGNFTVPVAPYNIDPTYTVTRDAAGTYTVNDNPVWKKGTAVVNYGASGEGLIFMTASESNAPYLSVLTHAGAPWTTTTTQMRLGNLNGFLDYSSALYGIAIGSSSNYLKYDPTNGLRVRGLITAESGSTTGLELDTYTKFLSHFDGIDAATIAIAETGQTLTFAGNAQIDTADKYFGTASALFDGTTDYITAPASANWNFDGNFTIDFWWKGNGINTTLIKSVTNNTWSTETAGDWLIKVDGNGYLSFAVVGGGNSASAIGALSTGSWYHIAVVRSGTSVQLYINGTASGSAATIAGTLGNTKALNIGQAEAELTLALNGWVDEVRISKGIARWTANFTLPTSVYADNSLSTVGAWRSSSDTTQIDGGKIYTNSILVAGLNSDATSRMFADATTKTNIEAWKHVSDVTKIDGGDIYTGTVTADKITAGTFVGGDFVIGNGGAFKSSNYAAGSAGFILNYTGFELNDGTMRGKAIINSLSLAGFANFGGDGSDGDVTISADTNISSMIKQYNNLTINAGKVLTAQNSIIGVKGTLTVNGSIIADGGGYAGGLSDTTTGGSAPNDYQIYSAAGGGGGAGSTLSYTPGGAGGTAGGSGGSGGSANNNGQPGQAAAATKQAFVKYIVRGEIIHCRGGGGGSAAIADAFGGAGGGFLFIECATFVGNVGSIISADGMQGSINGDPSIGSGGGGGGIVFLRTKTVTTNAGTIRAAGGAGRDGDYDGGAGGAGLAYLETIT